MTISNQTFSEQEPGSPSIPAPVPTRKEMEQALAQRHGRELQQKLSNTTVAICGLGGLGSNLAIALARAGVGKLILIDFDRVDISNLHRQQYTVTQLNLYKTDALAENLKAVAPYLEVTTHTTFVTEDNLAELVQDADIICEAFDRPEAKAMLTNEVLERFPDKYLVAASGMAGLGSANYIQTRRITSHFYLCGDGVSEVTDTSSLFASRVMLCAAHQAHMVLRIIAGELMV